MPQPIGAIRQLSYAVRDIEAAILKWVGHTGAGPFFVGEFRTVGTFYRSKPMEVDVRIGLAYSGAMQIELIQPCDEAPSIWSEAIEKRGEGLHHMAIRCYNDFDVRLACLNAEGCPTVVHGNLPSDLGRVAYVDATAHFGCLLELGDVAPKVFDTFDRMEAIHRSWDGKDPIRPLLLTVAES